MGKKIAWDVSHQEFIVSDHYYFWKLEKLIREDLGAEVTEIESLSEALNGSYQVLIFNYPEIPFSSKDVEIVKRFLEAGGRVGIFGYYKNEDRIADTINSLVQHFGLRHHGDIVTDEVNNEEGDSLFVHGKMSDGTPVALACTSTVEGGEPLVVGYDTAKSNEGYEPVFFVSKTVGAGELILGGTCVFWDNYSIDRLGNRNLIKRILG